MQTVYLSNGQECQLVETIGTKHIVRRVFQYEDEEYGYADVVESGDIVVDEIFTTRPVAKIDAEIKELFAKKDALAQEIKKQLEEKRNLKYECDNLTRTQIDQQKFIINRTEWREAKSIVFFPNDSIMPRNYDRAKGYFSDVKLSVTIKISDGSQQAWGYTFYDGDRYDSGVHLCPKYGILINPTPEDIDANIRKRLAEFKWEGRQLAHVPDEYLSESQLEMKTGYLKAEDEKRQARIKNEIDKLTRELNSYTAQLNGESNISTISKQKP